MLIRTTIAAFAGVLAVAAPAQSFDGTYTGSVKITKRVGDVSAECPAAGGSIAIVIRVSGGSASVTHAFATYTGAVSASGQIRMQGSRSSPSGGDRVSARYAGTIRGRSVSGSAVASTRSGQCHGRFNARR